MTATTSDSSWSDFLAEGRAARLALICLGIWLGAADSLVTTTIMPSVGRELGGYAYFSWATAAYMAGGIFSSATAARLSGRFGLRRAMAAAGVLTAIGCAISAVAPGMIILVAGRLVQGLGAGWIAGACFAAVGAVFPARHLARIFGLMSGVWGVATVLGPLVGGAFAEGDQWRALFWVFAVQCLAFVAAAVWLLPEDAPPAGHRTPWGQLAMVLAGVGLIGAADLTHHVLAAATLGLASLAMFLLAVRLPPKGEGGLFPRAASDVTGVIGAAYLANFALMAAAMSFGVYAPALLQKLYGLSPLAAGYAAGLESLGWTVAALAVAGSAARWHGPIIRAGAVSIVAGLAWLAVVMRAGPIAAILAAATLLGAGFGLFSGLTGRRVIAAAEGPEREIASAGINSVRQVGNAAGACVAGIIANLLGMSAGITTAAAQSAAVWLFVLALPLALVGALGAWRVASARFTSA
jgi:MFS family permease